MNESNRDLLSLILRVSEYNDINEIIEEALKLFIREENKKHYRKVK